MLNPHEILARSEAAGKREGELILVLGVPVDVTAGDRGLDLVDLGPLAGAVVGGGGGGRAGDVDDEGTGMVD